MRGTFDIFRRYISFLKGNKHSESTEKRMLELAMFRGQGGGGLHMALHPSAGIARYTVAMCISIL